MEPVTDKRAAAARGFVRSLNILLKFAKMYDFGHPRTARQYETAWTELRTALGGGDAGLLLAVTGDQLLVDGIALDSAAVEKSFARMLSSAGIASIYFSAKVNQVSLAKFVRAFPTGSAAKPAQLAEQMKAALQGDPNIHVNEICFVPADSAVAKTTVAAQLAARTLGLTQDQQDEMLQDPEKLLKLIVAAEGMKSGGRGGPGGPGGAGGPGSGGGFGEGSFGGSNPWSRGPGGTGGPGGAGGGGTGGGGTGGSGSPGPGGAGGSGGGPGAGHGGGQADGRGWGSAPAGGAGLQGGAAVVSGGAPTGGQGGAVRSSGSGGPAAGSEGSNAGWNIIGGSETGEGAGGGTQIDAHAGGFWFKSGSGDSGFASEPSAANPQGPAPENALLAGSASLIAGHRGGPGGAAGGTDGGFSTEGSTQAGYGQGSTPTSRWVNASGGIRVPRFAGNEASSVTLETGLMTLREDELQGILQVLSQIARTSGDDKIDPSAFQSRLAHLPRRTRFTISQALAALASQAPSAVADKPTLLKLAEHIAVRFALENYERGDLKVDAVRQLLNEMNQEINALRKVMGVYEEKMAEAGIVMPAHADALAEQFWAEVPEEKKRSVLESADAWCVPPGRIREFVEQLCAKGEKETAERILTQYASCLTDSSSEKRRQAAMGLAELAPVYAAGPERLLTETIRQAGVQLAEEKDAELQSLMSAAFVRLSQEAARKKSYAGLQRSVELVGYIEGDRPNLAQTLRPRIGVEERLPEFIDEALRSGEVPVGLRDLLRRMPNAASEQVASRFSRAGLREDCDLLISLLDSLGPEGLDHLRQLLREGPTSKAIETIGILARLDVDRLIQVLPARMRDWKRTAHDRVVRQVAASGSPERGRLLLELFDHLDKMIQPLAVDEIGMTGEQSANTRFLRIAETEISKGESGYLQLKAIEALGRLRTVAAEAALRKIAEARKAFRWAHPSELRLVAAQAMAKIDPDWVRNFVPRSGLSTADFSIEPLDPDPNSSAIRQRRYPRLRLEYPVPASTTGLKENCQVEIPEMTLGGGVALCEQSLHPGSLVGLRMNGGQKSIRAQTIVRDANTQARAFEVIDIELEERAKLRKLLVQLGNATKHATPNDRNRHATRTILSNPT
jgi:hypothetical protein